MSIFPPFSVGAGSIVVHGFTSGAHTIIWAIREGIFGGILGLCAKEKERNVPDEPITEAWRAVRAIYRVV